MAVPSARAYADDKPAFLYKLTDIGTLGGQASRGEAVNDSGWVAGESETTQGETRAFIWNREKGMRNLGTLGGNVSRAFDINNDGTVVGESTISDQSTRAFIWTESDGMRELAAGTGVVFSAAYAVNERGQVVGTVEDHRGVHAVAWMDGGMVYLNRLPGTGNVQPLDVNGDGDVVGQIETGTEDTLISHAFFFHHGISAANLTDFRFISPQSGSAAVAVNELGEAVGSVMFDSSRVRAIHYSRMTGVVVLDDRGALYSSAADLNGAGVVVGSSIASYTADETACAWIRDRWYDLTEATAGASDWQLTRALGINESGFITGYGVRGDDNRAFLLEPTGLRHEEWPSVGIEVEDHTETNDTEKILVIRAETHNDLPVRRVIFYHNDVQLGAVEEPPFEWGWQGSRVEDHEFVVVMTDNKGRIVRSPRVRLTGTDIPVDADSE